MFNKLIMEDIIGYMNTYDLGLVLEDFPDMFLFRVVLGEDVYIVPYEVLPGSGDEREMLPYQIINCIANHFKINPE